MTHMPMTDEVPLRVATFNLWGIFNSKMREARMKVFATKIRNYDIILLQEQFSPADFDLIRHSAPPEVQESYYFRRFRSSFYGSGCAVISRYPVKQAFFHTYPLQGYPEMVLHGDFFANKGAAMVRVDVPVPGGENGDAVTLQEVTLYTTHLVAIYQKVSQLSSWKRERYLPYRISQVISFANLIMSTSRPTDRVIIGGDFNCSQRSLEVQMMLILLRKHGYDLHAVLPTPRALLDTATNEVERDRGLRLFTFSNRNAFNTMSSSYFKLLKLEADIPSQIDHMFFSRPAFALREFASCPDVEEAYPRQVNGAPIGLVIFTRNEVYVPAHPSWWGSVWHQLLTGRRTGGGKTVADASADLYPLSDHYGVAAMLGMRIDEVEPTASPVTLSAAKLAATPSPTLTADELKVLETVLEYLESYVAKLRSQIRTTRFMAASSVLIVLTNLWVLHRLTVKEESRTAAMLEQMYNIAAVSAREAARLTKQQKPAASLQGVKAQLTAAAGWVTRHVHIPLPYVSSPSSSSHGGAATEGRRGVKMPLTSDSADAAAAGTAGVGARAGTRQEEEDAASAVAAAVRAFAEEDRPDFAAIAEALALRPLWATTWVSSALNIAASVGGTAAFAIGMFQRAGNANVLEEQVQQLRLL
ncbi:putative mitochondrial inositol phosphosphingolipid phospholipase C-Like (ISCL) [Leptomonas pyrrhocoris]|uniref:Putative mitochondrial inositol phosphosphingolipid phospholipase C-Like (ISCL) n=1 Tax=Leptomonas pyrrhocoris TaxID=157538 RepID=A0A0M9FRY7_LEPPY|nr:putative mitochondrial inositol phosphosphingolipid phospholipase C-Like (ISCL) [Leptomonas pyrrhocoris]KPA74777.1 putative mitochondrial inositol phosphosphingolipid phospholipase C-Like (ISCL) [Leptomonas pyrrhocoris]|eukprot:XP_015653216.1 putative mitochondrial inositol phosphosphingolipid phospholipase C-Like (ISCL) [Leptomonas pyrrhocoris]